MEQITDTKALFETARRGDGVRKVPVGPERHWARLNQATLNHVTLDRAGIVSDPHDPRSIPFERLAARMLRHVRQMGAKRIGFTAPSPGCGTSVLTANIALALTSQPDLKTILVDLDLRKPTLIHALDLERIGPKFSALVGSRRDFDSSAVRITEGLAFSLNATSVPEPTGLLTARATSQLLTEIENDFAPDLMLFDLPPMFPMPEALSALDLIDGAFIVARAGKSTAPEIDAAERAIAEHSKSFGVLLNDCQFPDSLAKTHSAHG